MNWRETLFAEGINKVGDKFFFDGFMAKFLFFVFDDDFGVGDFGDLSVENDEFWVNDGFDGGALDDKLVNLKV